MKQTRKADGHIRFNQLSASDFKACAHFDSRRCRLHPIIDRPHRECQCIAGLLQLGKANVSPIIMSKWLYKPMGKSKTNAIAGTRPHRCDACLATGIHGDILSGIHAPVNVILTVAAYDSHHNIVKSVIHQPIMRQCGGGSHMMPHADALSHRMGVTLMMR